MSKAIRSFRSRHIGELFQQSHAKGIEGIPLVALTMDRGLILRNNEERRVETNLSAYSHRLVRKGDLAYNMMRMWQGVCRMAEFDCLVSPAYVVLRPNDCLDSKYAEYLLRHESSISAFRRMSFGVVDDRLRLYFRDFRRIKVPVPESTAEQRKIARILTTVDNLIEKTEALIAKYQAIKQGMMHDLFTRGVDEHGHLRPTYEEAPELYKESQLGWIPKEWEVEPVGSLFEIQLGKMLSRVSKTGRYSYPYLANRNVQWDRVDLNGLEEMDFMQYEREKFSLKNNDLLVCEGGEVGRTSIWLNEIEDCYYQKAIHRLRPLSGRMIPKYMLRFMRYASIKGWFVNFMSQSSIAHLTREKLAVMPMLVQTKDEQAETVSRIDAIDTQIDSESDSLRKFVMTKSGLMQDLLTGKVRVKVDETEEVASV